MYKKPFFPMLRILIIKHGIGIKDVAQAIDLSYRNTLKKINFQVDFTFTEMLLAQQYFEGLGEKLTVDEIFYDWLKTSDIDYGKILPLSKSNKP